jgi:hypothetical protein
MSGPPPVPKRPQVPDRGQYRFRYCAQKGSLPRPAGGRTGDFRMPERLWALPVPHRQRSLLSLSRQGRRHGGIARRTL